MTFYYTLGSSGMAELRWNGSNVSSNSPPEPGRQQYAEELQPQVVSTLL